MTRIDRPALRRIVAALITAEMRRIRGPHAPQVGDAAGTWRDDLALCAELGLDSLDAVHVAAAIDEMFHIHTGDHVPEAVPPATIGAWLDRIEASHRAGSTRLSVLTSGSTGVPQRCDHRIPALLAEAAHFADRFAGCCRVIALVPANHIYGLIWTALLPSQLGIPVIAASVAAMPSLQPGDLIVAVPDQWRALARSGRPWPAQSVGISAGAPLDDAVAVALNASGLARMIDVYGASETGGIATRDAGDPVYTLLPRWRLAGSVDVECLVDGEGQTAPLPDRIAAIAENRFTLIGRRDGAVQVGGTNVWPQRVAAALRRCPGISDAVVRMGDGGRLKAFVIPERNDDEVVLSTRLRDHATRALTAAERPASYTFGAALPSNSLGKAGNWL